MGEGHLDIFKIFGIIAINNAAANSNIDETGQKASTLSDRLKNGLSKAAKIGAAAVAAVGTAAIAASKAFLNGIADTAEYGDNIDKMSQKLGMSAESYQEWDFIMQHCGTTIDAMQTGMKTLASAAETGSDAFEALGISQAQLAEMSQEELFAATITALQNVEDETERTYLAGQLLGRGATELGALLNTSAEDVEAMRQEVHDLGGVMSDEAVKAAAAYQDSLQNMKTAFSGIGRNLLSNFLPAVTTVMDGLAAIFSGDESGVELISEGLADFVDKLAEAMPRAMSAGAKIVESLVGAISDNLPLLLNAAIETVLTLVSGMIAALPELIPAAVDAIMTITTGLIEMLPEITQAAIDIIAELANGLAEALPELMPTVVSIILEIAAILTEPSNLTTLIGAAIEIITALANGLLDALPQLIEQAPEIISSLVEAIKENAPEMLSAAVEIITSLAEGIGENFGEIGETAGGAISSLVEGLGDFVTWLSEGSAGAEALKAVVVGVAAAFVTYKAITTAITVAQKAWSVVTKAVTAAQTLLNAVMNANPIMIIIIAIAALVAAFIYLWNNCEGFRQFFLDMWEGIKTAFAAVVDWFSVAASNVAQFFVSAWEWIKSAWASVTSFFSDIWQGICDVFSAIGEWFSEKFTEASEAIQNAWDSVVGFFEEIWESVKEVFSGALDVGKQIIEDIKQGISDAWDGLVSFFTGLWDSLFGNRTVNVSATASGTAVNGSHASGLDYVPFDGYIAELHKGEMVVPAAESNFLRSGGIAAATQQQNAAIVGLLGQILDAVRDVDMDGMTIDLNKREFGRLVRAVT